MGRPSCKKEGHERKFRDGRCAECSRVRVEKFKLNNPDSMKKYQKKYKQNNPEKCREAIIKCILKNPENKKLSSARWTRNNKEKANSYCAKRYASKTNSTPRWANQFFIEDIYDLAHLRTKATGFKWHVDHIVPLRSKTVCGLHVEHNLQVIPASLNQSKGNRHWPNQP